MVSEDNGKISAATLDLTANNTAISGINGNLPGNTPETSAVVTNNARVAILAAYGDEHAGQVVAGTGSNGNLQEALDRISNLIADYCSFHRANGDVI